MSNENAIYIFCEVHNHNSLLPACLYIAGSCTCLVIHYTTPTLFKLEQFNFYKRRRQAFAINQFFVYDLATVMRNITPLFTEGFGRSVPQLTLMFG